jgi:hypothetical protein
MEKDNPKVTPPNLIPEGLSAKNVMWLSEQLNAEYDHKRKVAARAIMVISNNPRNIRAY